MKSIIKEYSWRSLEYSVNYLQIKDKHQIKNLVSEIKHLKRHYILILRNKYYANAFLQNWYLAIKCSYISSI